MPIDILMPALSPTMEEGKLAKWLKAEGDTISAGDVIAEIETDKATMEVEAVDEGTLGKILVAEGTDNVKVNAKIAVLLAEGEDASAINASGEKPAEEKPAPAEAEASALRVPRALRLSRPRQHRLHLRRRLPTIRKFRKAQR
ncbi:pyruvate dehydrogenase subunit beta [Stappia aggregata IAM 12614]|uniref:Pyruvate dehydrogenase subunit beta n=1 Tax=Roseibium aggregatum (strain ATCC 25650 / DSM 13394 / JCM 20685 / NBRC 16684 / NCIMB 2208 / IAM 12614 / B1) TaxID=384765 RepID=A0NSV8_ROSAI|nr:pyruvate dehydrogenase subunit beta [Stappia aggregata IAM 12614] [Roseibium aggregatum IAM 12614]